MYNKEEFYGDNDKILKNIQSESHFEIIKSIIYYCKIRYDDACKLLQIRDNFSVLIERRNTFEEYTFRLISLFFAAYYRFKFNSKQIDIFEKEEITENEIAEKWQKYLIKESKRLAEDTDFCRNIIKAYCNQQYYQYIDYIEAGMNHRDILPILVEMKKIYSDFPNHEFRFGILLAEQLENYEKNHFTINDILL